MICKYCGYDNKDAVAFCAVCGAPLASAAPPAGRETKAPPQGYTAPPAAASVSQKYAPAAETPRLIYPSRPNPAPAAEPSRPVYAAPAAEPEKKPEKNSGKGSKIALIAAAALFALALVVAGVVGYLLLTQKSDKSDVQQTDEGERSAMLEATTALEEAPETQLEEPTTVSVAAPSDGSDLSKEYDDLIDEYNELVDKYNKLHDDYQELYSAYSDVYDEYDAMYYEYWFYNEGAVVCSDWNNYYHSYSCSDWDTNSYWIFNSEYAKYLDYEPCPHCQGTGN